MARFRPVLIGGAAALALMVGLAAQRGVAQQAGPGDPGGGAPQAAPPADGGPGTREMDPPRRSDGWRERGFDRDRPEGEREGRWRRYRDDDRGFGGWEPDERRGGPGGRFGFDDRRRERWDERDSGGRGMMPWRPRMAEPDARGLPLRPGMLGRLCGPNGGRLVGFMVERLERVTRPTEQQQPALQSLKEAGARALEIVRASCPPPDAEPPVTPPGRLAAAEKRLTAVLEAIRTLRPAMEAFYGSLSEEQKARLYASRPAFGGERRGWGGGDEGWRGRYREGGRDEPRGGRGLWRERDDERGGFRRMPRDHDRDNWPDQWRGPS